jgi:DNA-directed RNA polymerase specialized sigma24 family protein
VSADTFCRFFALTHVSVCAQKDHVPSRLRLASDGARSRSKIVGVDGLGPPMPNPASGARRRSAAAGLIRLLEQLDPDPTRAAAAYEHLRAALEKFFDWRGAWPPDECADVTLDRLVLKLGGTTQIDDVRGYARGIARLVLLEWQRRPIPLPIDNRPERAYLPGFVDKEQQQQDLLVCFDRCLEGLSAESRALVLEYYVAERREKIDNRRRLARALGLSESALRNRVQRIRDRLERCVQACTGGRK